jgi:hypothetical protein
VKGINIKNGRKLLESLFGFGLSEPDETFFDILHLVILVCNINLL